MPIYLHWRRQYFALYNWSFSKYIEDFFWLHWNWKHSLRSDNSLKVWLKKFHIFYSQPWVALTADILRMQPKRFPNQLLQTHCWHCLVNCILRRPCSVFPQAVVSEFITGIHSCGLAGTNAEQRHPTNTVCEAVFFKRIYTWGGGKGEKLLTQRNNTRTNL